MSIPVAPAPGNLRAILINNGAEKTSDPTVDLILSAENADEMTLATNLADLGLIWEPYVSAKEYELADEQVGPGYGDGEKRVYVAFKNVDGATDVFSASIILDTTPPVVGSIPIMINEGELKTSNRLVTLRLNAEGADFVEILNEDQIDELTGTIFPYAQEIQWTLSENNGQKTVYVNFYDEIGNNTSFYSASILLVDQEARNPVITEPEDGEHTTDHFITVRGNADADSTVQIHIEGD